MQPGATAHDLQWTLLVLLAHPGHVGPSLALRPVAQARLTAPRLQLPKCPQTPTAMLLRGWGPQATAQHPLRNANHRCHPHIDFQGWGPQGCVLMSPSPQPRGSLMHV
jgi:hypothetical protein